MALKLEQKHLSSVSRILNVVAGMSAYFLVKEDSDPKNVVAATANSKVLGVLPVGYANAEVAQVITQGIAIVSIGAAVAVGDYLQSDANGEAIPKGSAATTHYNCFGRALSAATNAHEWVTVQLGYFDYYSA